ncbi:DUF1524 domain-containing protein [Streptomyces sp. NPDC046979]|uniref:GmrSD restriction endonuclease domain-containing protein n=1 Tax=Streptomyces sp. NPDC046979 TaxID=3154604 RepID=UPI0033C1D2BB
MRGREGNRSPPRHPRSLGAAATVGLRFVWHHLDGANARADLMDLVAELATLTGGTWYSPYDDPYVDGPRGLDIDHLVPPAEAWDSGAGEWASAEREAYANDLDDQHALIAVTARSNRSKSDQDPATWQPPAKPTAATTSPTGSRSKTRWGLAIDRAEQAALTDLADDYPNTPVTVVEAR